MDKILLKTLLVIVAAQSSKSASTGIKDVSSVSGSGTMVSPKVVAFSAVAINHLEATSSDLTVVFPKVITNEGNGYSGTTGIFRAPVRGLYFFQAFCMSEVNKACGFDLYHNTKAITYFTYAAVPYSMGTGGNSIILQLEKFDNVFLKLKKGHAIHNHANEHHNTFTGYLLAEMPEKSSNNGINISVG